MEYGIVTYFSYMRSGVWCVNKNRTTKEYSPTMAELSPQRDPQTFTPRCAVQQSIELFDTEPPCYYVYKSYTICQHQSFWKVGRSWTTVSPHVAFGTLSTYPKKPQNSPWRIAGPSVSHRHPIHHVPFNSR
jgi:hypothetical protein